VAVPRGNGCGVEKGICRGGPAFSAPTENGGAPVTIYVRVAGIATPGRADGPTRAALGCAAETGLRDRSGLRACSLLVFVIRWFEMIWEICQICSEWYFVPLIEVPPVVLAD
jgi:hypothetical protein